MISAYYDIIYHSIINLSKYILEENNHLQKELNKKNKIIGFIGNNLPRDYYLCGICYIPTNEGCTCNIQHCIKCCAALNDVYTDNTFEFNDNDNNNDNEDDFIDIIEIDFDDYNPSDPDHIKRNKASRYGNIIIQHNLKWYKFEFRQLSRFKKCNPSYILFNNEMIDPVNFNQLIIESYIICKYDLMDKINQILSDSSTDYYQNFLHIYT